MNKIRKLNTIEEFEKLNKEMKKSFFIYKHSTICPTSSRSQYNIETFLKTYNFPIYRVLVIESRLLSNYIADFFSVIHQSPQVLLISNQKCLWHASHLAITETALAERIPV